VKRSVSWDETGEEEDGRRRGGAAAEAGGAATAPDKGPAAQRVVLHHQPAAMAYVPLTHTYLVLLVGRLGVCYGLLYFWHLRSCRVDLHL
jgi:hypothetical protein